MLREDQRTVRVEKRADWEVRARIMICDRMAEELLEKESLTLPDLVRILGDRPFPLKESIREYLQELEERKQK